MFKSIILGLTVDEDYKYNILKELKKYKEPISASKFKKIIENFDADRFIYIHTLFECEELYMLSPMKHKHGNNPNPENGYIISPYGIRMISFYKSTIIKSIVSKTIILLTFISTIIGIGLTIYFGTKPSDPTYQFQRIEKKMQYIGKKKQQLLQSKDVPIHHKSAMKKSLQKDSI